MGVRWYLPMFCARHIGCVASVRSSPLLIARNRGTIWRGRKKYAMCRSLGTRGCCACLISSNRKLYGNGCRYVWSIYPWILAKTFLRLCACWTHAIGCTRVTLVELPQPCPAVRPAYEILGKLEALRRRLPSPFPLGKRQLHRRLNNPSTDRPSRFVCAIPCTSSWMHKRCWLVI